MTLYINLLDLIIQIPSLKRSVHIQTVFLSSGHTCSPSDIVLPRIKKELKLYSKFNAEIEINKKAVGWWKVKSIVLVGVH